MHWKHGGLLQTLLSTDCGGEKKNKSFSLDGVIEYMYASRNKRGHQVSASGIGNVSDKARGWSARERCRKPSRCGVFLPFPLSLPLTQGTGCPPRARAAPPQQPLAFHSRLNPGPSQGHAAIGATMRAPLPAPSIHQPHGGRPLPLPTPLTPHPYPVLSPKKLKNK